MIPSEKPPKMRRKVSRITPVLKDGQVTQTITIEETDQSPFEGLKASDFQVQSILLSGQTDLLRPTAPISRGALENVDNMENQLQSLDSVVIPESSITE